MMKPKNTDGNGRFTAGNPGKPRGATNKITRDVREMVMKALDEVGGVAYLKAQAKKNPEAFLRLVGRCMPKDVRLSVPLDGDIQIRFCNGRSQL